VLQRQFLRVKKNKSGMGLLSACYKKCEMFLFLNRNKVSIELKNQNIYIACLLMYTYDY